MKLDEVNPPQNVFESTLNEISRGRYKSEEQKSALEKIKLLYESQESVINYLMIILQLYLRLTKNQFMERGSKY